MMMATTPKASPNAISTTVNRPSARHVADLINAASFASRQQPTMVRAGLL
jgi:hypothetical protein